MDDPKYVSAGKAENNGLKAVECRVESLCCHQMEQANLSEAAARLGIASSWQAMAWSKQ